MTKDDDESAHRYRLVVFDFDGTLADTYDWFASVINDVADRYHFRRAEEHEAELLRGMDARGVMRHLGISSWKLPFIARHMHRLAARDVATIRLFPGIDDLLIELEAAGFVLAVVSSNTEANIRYVLGPALATRFQHFACGASVFGKAKRLRAVMKAAGVAPSETLAIGDEIRDGDAARQAGCAHAAVSWGYNRAEALAARRPVAVFQTPKEIGVFLGAT
ncbi:HAD hydrolase-like protein [Methylobacterium brachythecii]|uniref:Haloacid dehalogenase n=1 Tax=Methylobacterium brachythecii TaxID=1176177 RepID=A0A7W6AKX3_9HYPH|nr:HAD hydrolase-like protein [Methylobacterium brachythecii]MBB3904391.1 phosphoglycolate phosphatase [Methylobacterium brachythecii]GLS43680.1 haloacid dehalogenase [Methylobacterium brachythecii]